MKYPLPRAVLALAVSFALLASQAIVLGDPGFGLIKKRKVTLQVRRPAVVRLANTSVAFRAGFANPNYRAVVAPLEATLETELVSNERTLVKKAAAEADWVLGLMVTGFSVPQPQQRQQQVKNNPPLTFARWTGSLQVAYQVVDRGGRVHAADNVNAKYDREFQTNVPKGGFKLPSAIPFIGGAKQEDAPQSGDDVMQNLVQDVVHQIAVNLGNTVQRIEAQVAGGHDQLERSADFMEQRLWSRAIETLEKTPAFAKPEDEAYRQYNLGLAYEAMSYEAKGYSEQRANLFKAQEYYDKATDMNQGQRYFVEVVARLKDSLARYRTLDAMQRDDQRKPTPQNVANEAPVRPAPKMTSPPVSSTAAAAKGGAAVSSKGGGTAAGAKSGGIVTNTAAGAPRNASASAGTASQRKALTVSDVIEMHGAGVQYQQIVEVIRSSPAQFNLLDKDTVLAIARAKLPINLQNEMRKKAGLAPLQP